MAYCPIIGSKNYSDLKNKLKALPSLKEKIIYLETEKHDTERILRHLKSKKHSLITFIRYKGRMHSINCPELYDISSYISEINTQKIAYIKKKLGPFFLFYKYGYIYPIYNFILYLHGCKFFKSIYSEYLFLLKQEIKLCEKQVSLGFIDTPIKTSGPQYDTNEQASVNLNRLLSVKVSDKQASEQQKYSKIKINLKCYYLFKSDSFDERFGMLFITKKRLLDALYNYDTTREKLIFLMDIRNNLSRIKKDFDSFKASSFDQEGIYLFRLANTSPELVYFIEDSVEKSKQRSKSGFNLYVLKTLIEFKAGLYDGVLELIDNQIKFLEERLSLERNNSIKAVDIKNINHQPHENKKDTKAGKKKRQNSAGKITWLGTETQLIDLFFLLGEGKLMPKYEDDDEIVTHFIYDKGKNFNQSKNIKFQRFRWLGCDKDFPVLINKLVDEKFILGKNKYKNFEKHFLNKDGKLFKNLPQLYYGPKNYSSYNPLIDDAVSKIQSDGLK